MIRKLIGWLLIIIGIILLAASGVAPIKSLFPFSVPPTLLGISMSLISLIFVLIGIVLVISAGRGSGRQAVEVPIYKGKNIIGYRRQK